MEFETLTKYYCPECGEEIPFGTTWCKYNRARMKNIEPIVVIWYPYVVRGKPVPQDLQSEYHASDEDTA